MKTITCDICGKEIKYYNFEAVFKIKIKVPYVLKSNIKDPKYQLCENCYGDMVKFMNGIRNELKRGGAE